MQKHKKLNARILSLVLSMAMIFTTLPMNVFAAEDVSHGTVQRTECHLAHKGCSYIEAAEGTPCGDLNQDGTYRCAPVQDEYEVSQNDAKKEFTCDHTDSCGYVEALDGIPCDHECELCDQIDSGSPDTVIPEDSVCICKILCTEDILNSVCPACKDDFSKCTYDGTDVVLTEAAQAFVDKVATLDKAKLVELAETYRTVYQLCLALDPEMADVQIISEAEAKMTEVEAVFMASYREVKGSATSAQAMFDALSVSEKDDVTEAYAVLTDIIAAVSVIMENLDGLPMPMNTTPAYSTNWAGTGEKNDPYQIFTVEELRGISYYSEKNPGNSSITVYFILKNDLDLQDQEWTPIRAYQKGSTNTFYPIQLNGDNHIISNFKVTVTEAVNGSWAAGLFGETQNGSISNLGIVDAVIDAGDAGYSSQAAGVLIGKSNSTAIENCFVSASSAKGWFAGGLVGSISTISCRVTNSYVAETTVSGKLGQGGLVGISDSAIYQNCYFIGSLIGAGKTGNILAKPNGSSLPTYLNCYVLDTIKLDGMTVTAGITEKNAAGFQSGEVAYLLNGDQSTLVYRQTLGESGDVSPTINAANKIVYRSGTEGSYTYYNEAGSYDVTWTQTSGTCTITPGSGYSSPVTKGQDFKFTVVWNSGYTEANCHIFANGTKISPINGVYTISNIQTAQTITVSAPLSYKTDWTGSGTADTPYQVTSAAQLQGIHYLKDKSPANTTVYFKLMNDIDLADAAWTPITPVIAGKEANTVYNLYTIHFDGNNHTVSNLETLPGWIGSFNNSGLFGTLNEGSISNLGMVDATINGGTGCLSGTLLGSMSSGRIANCYAENSSVSGSVAGGLAGYVETLENCYVDKDVTVNGTSKQGGLTGEISSTYGRITNSYFAGSLSGAGSSTYVLCTSNKAPTVNNCYVLSGSVPGGSTLLSGVMQKDTAAFSSGEVAYLLNGNQEYVPFRQTLGSGGDAFPVLDTAHKYVYKTSNGTYSNEAATYTVSWDALSGLCELTPVAGCTQTVSEGRSFKFTIDWNNPGISGLGSGIYVNDKLLKADNYNVYTILDIRENQLVTIKASRETYKINITPSLVTSVDSEGIWSVKLTAVEKPITSQGEQRYVAVPYDESVTIKLTPNVAKGWSVEGATITYDGSVIQHDTGKPGEFTFTNIKEAHNITAVSFQKEQLAISYKGEGGYAVARESGESDDMADKYSDFQIIITPPSGKENNPYIVRLADPDNLPSGSQDSGITIDPTWNISKYDMYLDDGAGNPITYKTNTLEKTTKNNYKIKCVGQDLAVIVVPFSFTTDLSTTPKTYSKIDVSGDTYKTPLSVAIVNSNIRASDIKYQWYSNITNSPESATPIAGATTANYYIPKTQSTTIYYFVEAYVEGSKDFLIRSTIQQVDFGKATVAISGLTAPSNRVYDGNAVANTDFGTPSYSPPWNGILTYTYYKDSVTEGNKLVQAPKVPGSYVVVVGIPDSDTDYTGKVEIPFIIFKKELTISSLTATNRAYDGTNTVVLTGGALSGVVAADNGNVSVVIPASGTMTDKDAGMGKRVAVTTPKLSGNAADNYTLAAVTGMTVDISAAPISITGTDSLTVTKVYDGTTAAGAVSGSLTFSGKVGSESVSVSAAAGVYTDADAGTGKTVTLTLSLDGDDKANYALSDTTYSFTKAAITKASYAETVSKAVDIMTGRTTAQTGTLTAADFFTTAPEGATIKSITAMSATNNILTGVPFVTSGALSYSSATSLTEKEKTDMYHVVIETTNYQVITATLSFTTIDKTRLTITGLTGAAGLIYNGTARNGYTGTATVTGHTELNSTLVYTYYVKDSSADTYTSKTTAAGNGSAGEGAAPMYVGSYKLVVSIPDSNNDYMGSEEIKFSIDQKEITVEAGTYKVSKEYDGTSTAGIASGTLNVTGILSTDTGVSVTPGTIPAYGDSAVKADYILTLPVSITGDTPGNYKLKTSTISVSGAITKKNVIVTVDSITAMDYTGSQLRPTATVKVNGGTIADTSYTVEYGTNIDAGTNAGSVTVKAKTDGNYTFEDITVNFTINQVAFTGTAITGSMDVVQNTANSNVEFDLSTLNFPAGFKNKNFLTAAIGTNSGGLLTGTPAIEGNKVKFAVAPVITGKTGVLEVTVNSTNYMAYIVKITVTSIDKTTVTITGLTAADLTYNGLAQNGYTGTATVIDHTELNSGLVYTYYVKDSATDAYTSKTTAENSGAVSEGTSPKNAGSYKLVVSIPADNNSFTGSTDVTFRIGQKEITVTNGSYKVSKAYDGTTSAGTGSGTLSVTGILSADTGVRVIPGTVLPAYSAPAVGSSYTIVLPISISGDSNGNYKIKDSASSIDIPGEITKASITVMVDAITPLDYTGSQLMPTFTVKAGSLTIPSTDYTVECGTNIDAGTDAGSVTIKAKTDGNYIFSDTTAKFTINKVAFTGPSVTGSKEVVENTTASKVEFDLSTLTFPEGFRDKTIDSVTIGRNTDGLLTGTPTISGNKVKFDVNSVAKDKTGVLNVTVNSKNYTAYTVAITITTVNKIPVTITATIANQIYNGAPVSVPNPTAVKPDSTSVVISSYDFKWQQQNGDGYTDISGNILPKNAGAYRLVVSVPGGNDTYSGSANVDFTISKATINIKANDKSAWAGDAKPPFTGAADYTVTGLVSGESLKTAPTLFYAVEPDMSRSGIVAINAAGAVAPDGGNYHIIYQTGTLTISSPPGEEGDGGGSGTPGTPPASKTTENVSGSANTTATVDKNGNASVSVSDKNIMDAIANAMAEADKMGVNAGEITAVIKVATGGKDAATVTVNLPETTQQQIISNKIDMLALVIEKPDISISLNLATITEINKQADADVQLSATPIGKTKLSGKAKTAIGNRPAFHLNVTYANGTKSVTNFGAGSVSVAIPYTLQAGEVAGGLYAVYIDGSGKANYITGSSYDASAKVLRFATNHFSVYGIGYKAPTAFRDIISHWAKTDIEFAFNRGLMSRTSRTAFSPNGAMTRGMFVTALGILAGVDVNNYKTAKFTDVKADAYYAPYVNWAAEKGITSGTTATTFSPDNTITRQEMAVFMSNYAKAMGCKVPKTREANTFADSASIGTWAAEAVKQMQMAGVFNGKNDNKFDPTGTATRGEAAAVLHRYVSLVIDPVTAQGLDTNDSGSTIMYENGKMVKSASRTIGSTTYKFNANGEATIAVSAGNKKSGTYVVGKGDSFWRIAKLYNCTIAELEKLNGKSRNEIIYTGQVLKVPQK